VADRPSPHRRDDRRTSTRRGSAQQRRGAAPAAPPATPGRANRRAPAVPEGLDPADLDPTVRRQLRSLPKGLADEVAVRLLATAVLIDEDPEAAYPHAVEAARIASRIAATREALGVVAYATGRWAQARTELRAAGRLSGSVEYLPMIADSERGLGRPDRALEIAKSSAAAGLDRAGAVEMRIVASGARRDMGQLDAAVLTLQTADLRVSSEPWAARLRYAYADALLTAGRADDALTWFAKAAAVDPDGTTEAQDRLDDLSGTTFVPSDEDLEDLEHAVDSDADVSQRNVEGSSDEA
jgi:tetratricopeptide (TPR) repeat protein